MSNGISFFGSTINSVAKIFKPSTTVKFTPPRTLDKTSRTFANGNSISSNTSVAGTCPAFLSFSTGHCAGTQTRPPWNNVLYGFTGGIGPYSECLEWIDAPNNTEHSRKTTTGESAWSIFTQNLVDKTANMMTNSTNDYVGTFSGSTLYHTAIYGVGGAVQAYNAGEFGPVGSVQAIMELDAIKGYLGREFLVKATLQGVEFDAIKGILDTAISDNNSVRVARFILDNNLTLGSNSATSAFVGFLLNFGYQGVQAWEETKTNNQPLWKNIYKEFWSLGRQTLGEAALTPPAWLNGKSFNGTLGNGDAVRYTFNPGSYTRQVNP